MSYNPFYGFNEAGTSPPPRNDAIKHREYDSEVYNPALKVLLEDMYEVSDDPSGSDPADYLPPEDAEVCRRVTALANHLGWPNANELGRLEVSKRPDLYTAWGGGISDKYSDYLRHVGWTSGPTHIAKAGLTKALFFKEKGDEHSGYILGKLGASPDQLVALCDDGLLRSLRSHELRKSKGIGWGRLPDPARLRAALAVGRMSGVEYLNVGTNPKSKTLAGKLLENVPGNLLDQATLRRFGLVDYKKLHSSDIL